jgi:ABC-type uncharacterized transport system auxiliary subunit
MTRARSILACLAVPIAFGQLVSCSGLSPANKTLYALDVAQPTATAEPVPARQPSSGPPGVPREQVVQVRRVNIAPPYDGLSLVYRTPGGSYQKDYYSEWVAPPEELFTNQLVESLGESGAFPSVVDGRSAAPHRFALETCITSLYGDFQDPRSPAAVLRARVYLIDDASGNRRIALQKRYDVYIPVAGTSAQQLVLGSGRAYRRLVESMTHDLAAFRTTEAAADAR